MIGDLKTMEIPHNYDLCSVCVKAKMKQRFNCQPVQRSKQPFKLVHSDLCRPMPTSIGGASYYILYIADFTRFVEVFPLVTKTTSEIANKFLVYKAWVETQGYRIKQFPCDNGMGEFSNTTFTDILAKNGITFELAPPYTQHKNGVSERMIQTINTKARCLLMDAGLPARFWAEAVKTGVYIHRQTPTSSLNEHKTPFEALYGTKPFLHHLRRYGGNFYRHLPKEQRKGKFAERARPCMFLGSVHKTTKIYRIWDFAGKGRALESSNIRFAEEHNAWGAMKTSANDDQECHLDSVFPEDNDEEETESHDTGDEAGTPMSSGDKVIPPRDPVTLSEDDEPAGNEFRCTYTALR